MSKSRKNSSYTVYRTHVDGEISMTVNGKKMYSQKEFDEVLQALKETIEDFELRSVGLDTADTRYRKAKDVIAKFEQVQP
jgi:hypothetical protein